jgi:hypothetical protein
VKIARLSVFKTFSHKLLYWAWSSRGSVLSPRCAETNGRPEFCYQLFGSIGVIAEALS